MGPLRLRRVFFFGLGEASAPLTSVIETEAGDKDLEETRELEAEEEGTSSLVGREPRRGFMERETMGSAVILMLLRVVGFCNEDERRSAFSSSVRPEQREG